MGIFTKDIKTMEDLLIHGLQDIYYADRSLKRCRK
ncbi:ferritin-like metal-binding protein YciE [Bradyrhizobium sp. JR7.2]